MKNKDKKQNGTFYFISCYHKRPKLHSILFHYGTIFLGSTNDTSGVGGGGE
jgi:hypothetical protein